MIPVEPMYIIFNLGMSQDFGEVDIENLPFPAYMMIDYIRVYQRAGNVSLGCSPPGFPTEQWIACHKDKYMTSKDDEILITKPCQVSGSVALFSFANIRSSIVLLAMAWLTILL